MPEQAYGYTVADLAARLRVSPDKIRSWISKGELEAVNVAAVLSGRPQFRVTPEALAAFERPRTSAPPPKTPRRRKRIATIDFYPD